MEEVIAQSASHGVVVIAAAKRVIARLALEEIAACAAFENIVSGSAKQRVITVITEQLIVPGATGQLIVPSVAMQDGNVLAGEQKVVSFAARKFSTDEHSGLDGDAVVPRTTVSDNRRDAREFLSGPESLNDDGASGGALLDDVALIAIREVAGESIGGARPHVQREHAAELRGEHRRLLKAVVAAQGEIQQRHTRQLETLRLAEDGEAHLHECAQHALNFPGRIKEAQWPVRKLVENFIEPHAPIVVRVVQVHLDAGKETATDARRRDIKINASERLDASGQHDFGNIRSGAVRLGGVADVQPVQQIGRVVRIQELLQPGSVIAERKINLRSNRAAEEQAERPDDRDDRRHVVVAKLQGRHVVGQQVQRLAEEQAERLARALDDREGEAATRGGFRLLKQLTFGSSTSGQRAGTRGHVRRHRVQIRHLARINATQIKRAEIEQHRWSAGRKRAERRRELVEIRDRFHERFDAVRIGKLLGQIEERQDTVAIRVEQKPDRREVGKDGQRLVQQVQDRFDRREHRLDAVHDRPQEVGEERANVEADVVERHRRHAAERGGARPRVRVVEGPVEV